MIANSGGVVSRYYDFIKVMAPRNQHTRSAVLQMARYDDVLRLRTKITRMTTVSVEHDYHLYRDDELLTEAHLVLCCVDANGVPQRLPAWMTDEG